MEEGRFREERNDMREGQDERWRSKGGEESQKEEHQKIREKRKRWWRELL